MKTGSIIILCYLILIAACQPVKQKDPVHLKVNAAGVEKNSYPPRYYLLRHPLKK
jgi:hypothetical protein